MIGAAESPPIIAVYVLATGHLGSHPPCAALFTSDCIMSLVRCGASMAISGTWER
jgi:hypothetical protein